MRIKFTNGSDPLGLVTYLLDPAKQPSGQAMQVQTNLESDRATEMAAQLRSVHELNRRVKKTMGHFSISLTPGEQVTPQMRGAITDRLLHEMGYGNCPFLSVEHFDQVHKAQVQHWHIGVSTADWAGKHVSDSFIRLRLRKLEPQLEQEFGLVASSQRPERDRHNLTTGEYRYKQRTGEVLPKEKLWQQLQAATQDQPSIALLLVRLKANDVEVQLKQVAGDVVGISYGLEGQHFTGRQLGRQYSFVGMQRNGLVQSHHPNQAAALHQVSQWSASQCRYWLQQQQQAIEKPLDRQLER
ncbi:relaxase/mobilization nuclease domain-containing protein [Microcoleus sp. FACHB-1515]|uniref:relaxase/mobilization nuclease domain-containing protein n=1 Tax=Cyanophyceae TaxID=3028117 RepID=UPI001685826C|nr:relaxase/mobilization nuclease domain-containing protein [Microcoleus sp. FACHB-1515]MBD2093278.1 relaxase/mobilization nuclease domain-containing protein [Microcoleus sp. FACHB-1515]